MIERPDSCTGCRLHYLHHGFCPDWVPANPKIAIVLDTPGSEDVLLGEPLSGRMGHYVVNKLLEPLGYGKKDVLVSNVLRCRPPGGKYPLGEHARHGQKMCRQYDDVHSVSRTPGGIITFDPNLFVITEHPLALFRTPAMIRMVRRHLEKAFKRAEEGWRVCVLMGTAAMGLVAPELKGGMKQWHGHFFEGSWPGLKKGGFQRV